MRTILSKKIFLFCVFLLGIIIFAEAQQNYQQAYLDAKNFLNRKEYTKAKEAFKSLTIKDNENPFNLYASFFYAISSYHLQETDIAKSMLLEIEHKAPEWKSISYVYYWLADIYFTKKDYANALAYLKKIEESNLSEKVKAMKVAYLNKENNIHTLQDLLQKNQQDTVLAQITIAKIKRLPTQQQDKKLLEKLSERYESKRSSSNENKNLPKSVKKRNYRIAVLFPFMINQFYTDVAKQRNQFVLDLYQGIKIGVTKLKEEGIYLRLSAYDTKKDSLTTLSIIKNNSLDSADLIIGPLYAESSKLALSYAKKHKKNIVNPISNNALITEDNPHSFLFQSSVESQVMNAASFAKEKFTNKKVAIIYGKKANDSILAHSYKYYIEQNGFDVILFKKQNFIPATANIGHIFIANDNSSSIVRMINHLDKSKDPVPIIITEEWLQASGVSIDQLSRLSPYIIAPSFVNYNKDEVEEFKKYCKDEFNVIANIEVFTGYELILFYGRMLHRYGTYFQNEWNESSSYQAELFERIIYQNANNNQYVPILTLEESEFKLVNNIDKQKK